MNRPFLVIALATLLAAYAHANDVIETDLVAVNTPAFAAVPVAAPAPAKVLPATPAPTQPLLQPLLDRMALDLESKVDQHVDSSLAPGER